MVPDRCACRQPDQIKKYSTGKHQIKRGIREFGLLKNLKKGSSFNNFA
jgi:hypothetical protein